jgi:hypothetical protein
VAVCCSKETGKGVKKAKRRLFFKSTRYVLKDFILAGVARNYGVFSTLKRNPKRYGGAVIRFLKGKLLPECVLDFAKKMIA